MTYSEAILVFVLVLLLTFGPLAFGYRLFRRTMAKRRNQARLCARCSVPLALPSAATTSITFVCEPCARRIRTRLLVGVPVFFLTSGVILGLFLWTLTPAREKSPVVLLFTMPPLLIALGTLGVMFMMRRASRRFAVAGQQMPGSE